MNDINTFLAETVMGYHKSKASIYEDIDDILFGDPSDKEYWYDGDLKVMEVTLWKPLENVYQARNVLRKLVEGGWIGGKER